jgi:hypothetical protein
MAVAAAFSTWLVVSHESSSGRTTAAVSTTAPAVNTTTTPSLPASGAFAPVLFTGAELKAAARSLGQPLYWAGAEPGQRYELSRDDTDNLVVRYLPAGVAAGDPQPRLLVATIPLANAYAKTEALAQRPGATSMRPAAGGLAWYHDDRPATVYLAHPNLDYVVEINDPSGRARQLVSSGRIRPIG